VTYPKYLEITPTVFQEEQKDQVRKQTSTINSLSNFLSMLFSMASRPALGSNQPAIQWTLRAVSSGVKRPGRRDDHSLPSSAEVKNDGGIPHLPHTSSWRDAYLIKYRYNFTLYISLIMKYLFGESICSGTTCIHINTYVVKHA
jgi:hypothetical protein